MISLLLMLLASPSESLPASDAMPYPEAAIQRGEQGSVTVGFDINDDGRAENCRVVRSSKSRTLDEFICPVVLARSPMAVPKRRDHKPRHVGGSFHFVLLDAPASPTFSPMAVTDEFIIAARTPSPEPLARPAALIGASESGAQRPYVMPENTVAVAGAGIAVYQIGADGLVADCRILGSSGSESWDAEACKRLTKRMKFSPALTAAGQPIKSLGARLVLWNPRPTVVETASDSVGSQIQNSALGPEHHMGEGR